MDSVHTAQTEDGRLGIVRSCYNSNEKLTFVFAWSVALVSVVATCVISWRHVATLERSPICTQRLYYRQISVMPVIFALSAAFVLLAPRTSLLAELIQVNTEAQTLATFGILAFTLSARMAQANGHTDKSMVARIVNALAEQGPRNHFAVPPLGCFLRCCAKPHDLTAGQLGIVVRLIRQYTIIAPILVILKVFAKLGSSEHVTYTYHAPEILSGLLKLSLLVSIYGLFIMYFSSHQLLHDCGMTKKFVTIKVALIITASQRYIVDFVIKAVTSGQGIDCLDEENLQQFWCQWVVAVESVIFMIAFSAAFPANEIIDSEGTHFELLSLGLKWQHQEDAKSLSDKHDDASTSEGADGRSRTGSEDSGAAQSIEV